MLHAGERYYASIATPHSANLGTLINAALNRTARGALIFC